MNLVRPSLYTDENVDGALVRALPRLGWNVVRAIDVHPAGTVDEIHFETAAAQDRVLVSQDSDMLEIAVRWQRERRPFPGLIYVVPHKFHTAGAAARAMQAVVVDLEDRPLRDRVHFL